MSAMVAAGRRHLPRGWSDLGRQFAIWFGFGFVDQHRDGLVSLAANPYAAMPSLHAADALIVGIILFSVCRTRWAKAFWAVWPVWVWFAVMATGNHFWLDCMAGVGVALMAMAIVYNDRVRPLFAARRA